MERLETHHYETRLRSKGQITLPKDIRDLLSLKDGDNLIFLVNDNGQICVQRQQVIPPDQAWFWTERWQRMEREAQEDIDAGRVHQFENADEAIGALKEIADAEDTAD
jgi:antitoxin MazE